MPNYPGKKIGALFMNVKKKSKTFCGNKVLVCSKGPPLNPLNRLRLFPQNVLVFFLHS